MRPAFLEQESERTGGRKSTRSCGRKTGARGSRQREDHYSPELLRTATARSRRLHNIFLWLAGGISRTCGLALCADWCYIHTTKEKGRTDTRGTRAYSGRRVVVAGYCAGA